ncbi:MAG: LacI family DNA-binding transcriptional regulator [Tessaracoccus sp.]|uniref:LacI family DNA-binding transcriptional regulator n=1 Tax=Tessaracoccus sp. TaxID=1971211 RepID=UPI001ECA07EF|nr:LacI family DNA-binding transcriptional regulator [Tessaracoccus sp.]MBK7819958.1 LacI family DNA-binding transcriptional regulator [Tessaracoccus sp.]
MGIADRAEMVTLADVAERAGVSKSTASKALTGRYGVSPATRDRVTRVAEELRFVPNLLARGLGGGRTHTVGIVTPDIDGRFAPQIMAGVEDALGADRSSVIMCNSRGREDWEVHHIRELLQRSVDGLIMVGNRPEPRAPIAVDSPVPVVYAFAPSTEENDTSVVCDNVEAGRMAVRHLVALGKRRIVHFGGPDDEDAARDRRRGVEEGLKEANLAPVPCGISGTWSEQWGWDAAARLLDEGVAFDGVVGGDDQVARGALDQLLSRGRKVPQEVEVIGFDNWMVISQYSRNPFSSVDLDLYEVGRVAANALLELDGPAPGVRRVAGKVVVRPERG